MRGEKMQKELGNQPPKGSPPRARGKGSGVLPASLRAGITPACAGKSTGSSWQGAVPQDHPRVRGEKIATMLGIVIDKGSPPRARGKAVALSSPREARGITPACAGKSR